MKLPWHTGKFYCGKDTWSVRFYGTWHNYQIQAEARDRQIVTVWWLKKNESPGEKFYYDLLGTFEERDARSPCMGYNGEVSWFLCLACCYAF